MPKSLYIDPQETLRPKERVLKLPEIPVMQYKKTIRDELEEGRFSEEDLLRIYRDMYYIREFETMLNLVKTTGGYNGVPYNNPALLICPLARRPLRSGWPMPWTPTTLSRLPPFPRRNSGKGLRSIQILPDQDLLKIMEAFWEARP